MHIPMKPLDRRTLLRGAGAALALPLLDAMFPTAVFGAAGRAVTTPKPRLGFFYVPNGVNMKMWTPAGEGGSFALSPSLKALEPLRDQVVVLSGLSHHQADRMNDGAGDHSRATAVFLSGAHAKRTQGSDLYLGTTADQIAAKTIGTDSPLASLELCIEERSLGAVCDEGYTCAYGNTISWSSPTTPLPMERNPRLVFERLFGEGGTPEERIIRARQDRSILDAVLGDMGRLQRALGGADRRRVEQYSESIRDVEQRLQRVEAQNRQSPTLWREGMDQPLGVPESFEEHIKLMLDLQALAYQAEITRVSAFQFGRETCGRSYPQIGVPDGHHPLSHHDNDSEKLAKIAKIDAYHVQILAYFLEKLRSIPDGDGTLLDHSLILYGCGISNGNLHNHDHLPVLVAGGKAFNVRGGRHVKYSEEVPMSNLLVTILAKAGVPVESIGDSSGTLAEL